MHPLVEFLSRYVAQYDIFGILEIVRYKRKTMACNAHTYDGDIHLLCQRHIEPLHKCNSGSYSYIIKEDRKSSDEKITSKRTCTIQPYQTELFFFPVQRLAKRPAIQRLH